MRKFLTKTFAMDFGKTVFEEEGVMELCTIPFVNWKHIEREFPAQAAH